jgi:hypothetical protein
MLTSDTIIELAQALAEAQGKFAPVKKTKTATVKARDPSKPGYTYSYADLADLLEAVRPSLSASSIAILQSSALSDGWMVVTTRLLHASGEWIEADAGVPCGQADAQAIGSAITYARRYGLSALVGVAAEEDDDGGAAVDSTKDGQQQPQQRRDDGPRRPLAHPPASVVRPLPPLRDIICPVCKKPVDIKARHSSKGDHKYHHECFDPQADAKAAAARRAAANAPADALSDAPKSKREQAIAWMLEHQGEAGGDYTRTDLEAASDEWLREAFRALKARVAEAAQHKAIGATTADGGQREVVS